MAGSETLIDIRQLTERCDFERAVALQQQIWGFDEVDLLPVRLFVVANKVGGHIFGAFDGDRMIAFLLAIPGLKAGGRGYLHSHMMGVLPEYRNSGVGRRLKLAQRDEALARGIDLIEWTFDPLELKNAFFNMERLGAVVCRYVENQYGISSSALHGSLPTDRCIAEWWIRSPRVEAILNGEPAPRTVVETIPVPVEIATLRGDDPRRARVLQKEIGDHMQQAFAKGLAVIGVERQGATTNYLLGSLS